MPPYEALVSAPKPGQRLGSPASAKMNFVKSIAPSVMTLVRLVVSHPTINHDACRRHGISSATFYKYKSKYGGMEPSDAKRLRALEDENGKLKKLLAEQMLDNAMLRDINSKKW